MFTSSGVRDLSVLREDNKEAYHDPRKDDRSRMSKIIFNILRPAGICQCVAERSAASE
jgi:hypothetical protein